MNKGTYERKELLQPLLWLQENSFLDSDVAGSLGGGEALR